MNRPIHLQADVAQYPERFVVGLPRAEHDLLQPVVPAGVELVGLPEVSGPDDDIQMTSTMTFRYLSKNQ